MCDAMLAPLAGLRKQLVREMRARLKEDDSEPAAPHGPWSYYSRFRHGGQHRIYCRRPRAGGREAVLLDGDARARRRLLPSRPRPPLRRLTPASPGAPTPQARRCTRSASATSPTTATFPTGSKTPAASSSGPRDGDALLYVAAGRASPALTASCCIGSASRQEADALLFEEPDPAWFLSLKSTRLGRRAFIHVHGHDAQEHHVVDLAAPAVAAAPHRAAAAGLPLRAVRPRRDLLHQEQRRRARFRDRRRPRRRAAGGELAPLLAGVEGRLIESVDPVSRSPRHPRAPGQQASPRRARLSTGEEHEIAFEAPTYYLKLETTFEFDSSILRFSYSSLACQQETYDYDMAARQRYLVKKQATAPGYDASAYLVEAIEAAGARRRARSGLDPAPPRYAARTEPRR